MRVYRTFTVAAMLVALAITTVGAIPAVADPPISECDIVGTEGDDLIDGTGWGTWGPSKWPWGQHERFPAPPPGPEAYIRGTDAPEVICGLGGDDNIMAGRDDVVYGGSGADWIFYGAFAERLDGGPGDDILGAGLPGRADRPQSHGFWSGDAVLYGGPGDDTLIGSAGSDRLYGGPGDDRLKGRKGDDQLYGGDGHDWLVGGSDEDFLAGGAGSDRLEGRTGDDRLEGRTGDDWLEGGKARDQLVGGAGDDVLRGGDGADVLDGGKGRDKMAGMEGKDKLFARDWMADVIWGGPGYDTGTWDWRDNVTGVEKRK